MFRLLIAATLAMSMAAMVSAVVSTFDINDEGWTITGDAQGSSVLPTYHATGGNPGGYISATDNVQGGVWYFKAADAFHGDRNASYNAHLAFDLRQSSLNSQFNAVDIYLRGAEMELTYDTPNNPGTTWTAYSILLTETAGWKLGAVAPTQVQMLQVLANVTDLQIRGEFVTGADTGSLDNAQFTHPHPGDANNDGAVNVGDLGIVAAVWMQGGRKYWRDGDFTGDGIINVGDLGVLAFNWGWTGSPASPSPVPEPAGLLLLATGGWAALRRRRT